MNQKKYTHAISDLTKAITLNSKNIKALKRLAYVHLTLGELLEAEIYLKRCVDIEPKEISHQNDVQIVRQLVQNKDEMKKAKFLYDYKTAEKLAEFILKKCPEDTSVKLIYLESLVQNCKAQEALNFVKFKLNDLELKNEEFQFLHCQAYFHDGKL